MDAHDRDVRWEPVILRRGEAVDAHDCKMQWEPVGCRRGETGMHANGLCAGECCGWGKVRFIQALALGLALALVLAFVLALDLALALMLVLALSRKTVTV